jgi:hypothetical protein
VLALVTVVILPIMFVAALLVLAERSQRARAARVACQVALTEAIHRELGAVVAPVVRRRAGRGWRVEVAVPFERPAVVARIVSLARTATARDGAGASPLELVLTEQAADIRRANAGWVRQADISSSTAGRDREAVAWTGTTTSRAS